MAAGAVEPVALLRFLGRNDAVPGRQEPAERIGRDRFDLGAQRGQRTAAQQAKHFRVDEFPGAIAAPVVAEVGPGPTERAELALGHPAGTGQSPQRIGDNGDAQSEERSRFLGHEGTAGARIPAEQPTQRIRNRLQQRRRNARRQRRAQRVAEHRRIGRVGPPLHAADPDHDGAPGCPESGQRGRRIQVDRSGLHLVDRERAENAQQVGDLVRGTSTAILAQPLQVGLCAGQRLRVEQVAQREPVTAAEQFGQQRGIDGESGSPTFGQWRVALVEELGDVTEEQGTRERRRRGRGDLDDAHRSGPDLTHQRYQGGYVEDVGQAFPNRLGDDREGRVLGGYLQQLAGPLTLLPERLPFADLPARQQQRARRALAEAGREDSRTAYLRSHLGFQGLRIQGYGIDHLRCVAVVLHVRQPQHDAVVGVHGLYVDSEPLAHPGRDHQGPRRVHRGAVRRVDDQPPIAEFIPEPFHRNGFLVRNQTDRGPLLIEVGDQVVGGVPVKAVAGQPLMSLPGRHPADGTDELTVRPAELSRPSQSVALPERQPTGDAGRRDHQHLVVGDLQDPPRAGPEGEHVAHPGFVDHLLVEFAHSAPGTFAGGEEDAEHAAVRDGAAGGDRQPLCPRPAGQLTGDPVPVQPRPQLGELFARVPPGQHVQDRLERTATERREGRGPPEQRMEFVDGDRIHRTDRHDLLGRNVERIRQDAHRLDGAGFHPTCHYCGRDQIATVLREHHPMARCADLVSGPADPLQSTGDRWRRLHLDHQIDRTHVDAQFE